MKGGRVYHRKIQRPGVTVSAPAGLPGVFHTLPLSHLGSDAGGAAGRHSLGDEQTGRLHFLRQPVLFEQK